MKLQHKVAVIEGGNNGVGTGIYTLIRTALQF